MSKSNKGAKNRLLFMLLLTTTFFVIEILVGYATNSMALVADSFHMLSDVVALVIAFLSVLMSPKKWSKNTFGWARAEVLGALVNAVFLCALCFSILVESLKRFFTPEEIHQPDLIILVGILGLIVNLIGLFLFKDNFHGHSHGGTGHHHQVANTHNHHSKTKEDNFSQVKGDVASLTPQSDTRTVKRSQEKNDKKLKEIKRKQRTSSQMNMRGVFLHVLADALGSVIVCISASIILFTNWSLKCYVDPLLSIIMVSLITYSTWPLLVESGMILLQTVPTHIEVDSLRRKLLQEIDGVLAVHELHVWQLAGDRIIASAHIRCHNLQDYMRIAEKVKEFFHNEGIHSTTIQPEFVDLELEYQTTEEQENCVLDCPENTSCAAQTCCGLKKDSSKINIQNGVYKCDDFLCDKTTPTAIRRRPRYLDGAENDISEGTLFEVNVETPNDDEKGETDLCLNGSRTAKVDENVV